MQLCLIHTDLYRFEGVRLIMALVCVCVFQVFATWCPCYRQKNHPGCHLHGETTHISQRNRFMYSKGSLTWQTPMHLLVITDNLLSKNDLCSTKIKPQLTKLQIKIMFVCFLNLLHVAKNSFRKKTLAFKHWFALENCQNHPRTCSVLYQTVVLSRTIHLLPSISAGILSRFPHAQYCLVRLTSGSFWSQLVIRLPTTLFCLCPFSGKACALLHKTSVLWILAQVFYFSLEKSNWHNLLFFWQQVWVLWVLT